MPESTWMQQNPERAREIHHKWNSSHVEQERLRKREWKRENPDKVKKQRANYREGAILSSKKWIEKNPLKRRAHNRLWRAILERVVIRPNSCSRCRRTTKPQGHHPDYNFPLKVEWLCIKCHRELHGFAGNRGGAVTWEQINNAVKNLPRQLQAVAVRESFDLTAWLYNRLEEMGIKIREAGVVGKED